MLNRNKFPISGPAWLIKALSKVGKLLSPSMVETLVRTARPLLFGFGPAPRRCLPPIRWLRQRRHWIPLSIAQAEFE